MARWVTAAPQWMYAWTHLPTVAIHSMEHWRTAHMFAQLHVLRGWRLGVAVIKARMDLTRIYDYLGRGCRSI